MRIIIISLSVMLITLSSYAQQPYILVTETYSAKVSKIDPVTNSKIASIRVADSVGVPTPNITKIVLDTVHNWAFIACNTANAISVIDLNTWTATYPPITVPGINMPKGLAINKTCDTLYVCNDGAGGQDTTDPLSIVKITGSTFPPTLSLVTHVPCGKQPTNVVLSHDGKYAVVSCRNQARIAVVNLHTNTVVFQHNYPNVNYEPEGIDIHPILNLFYCTTHGMNTIDILSTDSMSVLSSVPITYTPPPPQPSGGVFSPSGNLFLLSAQTTGKMYRFNTTNPYNPVQLSPVISSGGVQPHMAVFLNDTIAYIPNTNNTQPVGSVSYMSTGNYPTLLGQVSGIWNGPLSMVLVKNPVIGIEPISGIIPKIYNLSQNYPNPFNPMTKIRFSLPNPSKGGAMSIQLIVYDVLGREVASLIPPLWGGQEGFHSGTYEVEFDGSNYPSGVYFYQLISSGYIQTKKMLMIK